jgi:hypothetical protein
MKPDLIFAVMAVGYLVASAQAQTCLAGKSTVWLVKSMDWFMDASDSYSGLPKQGGGGRYSLDSCWGTVWDPYPTFGDPYWISYDLKSQHNLTGFSMVAAADERAILEATLEGSVDGSVYKVIANIVPPSTTYTGEVIYDVNATLARYVRLNITKINGDWQPMVMEVNFRAVQ